MGNAYVVDTFHVYFPRLSLFVRVSVYAEVYHGFPKHFCWQRFTKEERQAIQGLSLGYEDFPSAFPRLSLDDEGKSLFRLPFILREM